MFTILIMVPPYYKNFQHVESSKEHVNIIFQGKNTQMAKVTHHITELDSIR